MDDENVVCDFVVGQEKISFVYPLSDSRNAPAVTAPKKSQGLKRGSERGVCRAGDLVFETSGRVAIRCRMFILMHDIPIIKEKVKY